MRILLWDVHVREAAIFVWAVFRRDFRALSFALFGCAVSAIVAIYQFAVFTSFLATATLMPRMVGGDVWVGDYGVDCFDLASPIAEAYAGLLLRFFSGATYRRVYIGFSPYLAPNGVRSLVTLVGVDNLGLPPGSFTADIHDEAHLDLSFERPDAEIAGLTQEYLRTDRPLASFLGTPYVLMNGSDAADTLRLAPDRVSYLVLDLPHISVQDRDAAIAGAHLANPQLMIRASRDFVISTGLYWLTRTGGGAAILMACVLAAGLMVVFLVNGITRFVQRRRDDIMSLLGLGCSTRDLGRILLLVALLFPLGGVAIALLVVPLLRRATEAMVPWVAITGADYLFSLVMVGVCTGAGAVAARNEARKLPLAEIFRT